MAPCKNLGRFFTGYPSNHFSGCRLNRRERFFSSFCVLQRFIFTFFTLCTLWEVSGLLHDCEASLLRVITLVWIQAKNRLVQCAKAPSESNQMQSSAGLNPRWWLCGYSMEIIIYYYLEISKILIPIWQWCRKVKNIGGASSDNLPSPVRIGLTDLPNIGGPVAPLAPLTLCWNGFYVDIF